VAYGTSPLIINPHREVKRTRHYTAHVTCKDLGANEATGQTPLYRACCPCSRRQGRIQKAVAPSGPHFTNGITEYLHITAQIIVFLDNKVEMVWSCCHHGNKERGNSLMWMAKERVADDTR